MRSGGGNAWGYGAYEDSLRQQKARGGRPHDWDLLAQIGGGCSNLSRTCKDCGQSQRYGRCYGSNHYPGYAPLPREEQDCPGKYTAAV